MLSNVERLNSIVFTIGIKCLGKPTLIFARLSLHLIEVLRVLFVQLFFLVVENSKLIIVFYPPESVVLPRWFPLNHPPNLFFLYSPWSNHTKVNPLLMKCCCCVNGKKVDLYKNHKSQSHKWLRSRHNKLFLLLFVSKPNRFVTA